MHTKQKTHKSAATVQLRAETRTGLEAYLSRHSGWWESNRIADELGLDRKSVALHLAKMAKEKVIESRKEGKKPEYANNLGIQMVAGEGFIPAKRKYVRKAVPLQSATNSTGLREVELVVRIRISIETAL